MHHCESPEFITRLVYSSRPTIGSSMKSVVEIMQLSTAIHDEGDGLIHCEWYDTHLCLVCFGLAWTDIAVTLDLFMWSVMCNLIDLSIGSLKLICCGSRILSPVSGIHQMSCRSRLFFVWSECKLQIGKWSHKELK